MKMNATVLVVGIAVVLVGALSLSSSSLGSPAVPTPTAQHLFLAMYDRGPSWIQGKTFVDQPHMADHVAYFRGLGDDLIAAGPIEPLEGSALDGLILFTARDRETAQHWLDNDPLVIANVTSARLVSWSARSIKGWSPVTTKPASPR